jgi:hypothetical protein
MSIDKSCSESHVCVYNYSKFNKNIYIFENSINKKILFINFKKYCNKNDFKLNIYFRISDITNIYKYSHNFSINYKKYINQFINNFDNIEYDMDNIIDIEKEITINQDIDNNVSYINGILLAKVLQYILYCRIINKTNNDIAVELNQNEYIIEHLIIFFTNLFENILFKSKIEDIKYNGYINDFEDFISQDITSNKFKLKISFEFNKNIQNINDCNETDYNNLINYMKNKQDEIRFENTILLIKRLHLIINKLKDIHEISLY